MYDVVVIGAGIVGCSIARELSRYDIRTVVLEKSYDAANGSTKANSGIVHAGYDAHQGTLKAKLNVNGCEMYQDLCRELDVPYRKNGSLVAAFNDAEQREVESLYKRGIDNGVPGLEIIDKNRVLELEPNVNPDVICALYAPTAGIVSPFEMAIALGENAAENGTEFLFNTQVENVYKVNNKFVIETNNGKYETAFIVNAAGIYSDKINKMLGGREFRMIPTRGEYCLFDKSTGNLVNMTIFPTPTDKGKGILVAPTVHGNIFIGPNSVAQDDREDTSTYVQGIEEIVSGAKKSVQAIDMRCVITSFTGIRSKTSTGDFIIDIPVKGAVNAAGIESPGLSSAPAIAQMVSQMLEDQGLVLRHKTCFKAFRSNTKRFIDMNDDERKMALSENPLYGRIICRCEHVTEGDIVNAIRRPVGATTVDGVKRRTRAGMGRCQGGFCMPRVIEILSRELGIDKKDIKKSSPGSYILTGKTK